MVKSSELESCSSMTIVRQTDADISCNIRHAALDCELFLSNIAVINQVLE